MALPIQLAPEDRAAYQAEVERKRRKAESEARAAMYASTRPVPGRALYDLQQRLPVQLPYEDRLAASGETTTGWMGRRWSTLLSAGWDPNQVPIPVLHDLATMPVDDATLSHLLGVSAPMQQELVQRIREANQRRAWEQSMLPERVARAKAKAKATPPPPLPGNVLHHEEHSIVGWDARRQQWSGAPAPSKFGRADEAAVAHLRSLYLPPGPEDEADPYPSPEEVLTEIAGDPGRRTLLSGAPWLGQFLTTRPVTDAQLQAARTSLRGYLTGQPTIADKDRDAALGLLDGGYNPIDIAYWLVTQQAFTPEELRQRGLVDAGAVLDRMRQNSEQIPRRLGQVTGGLIGRQKLDLLAFDARTEDEQLRLAASGIKDAVSTALVNPGRILDGLNWTYDHLVSEPLGFVSQYLLPLNALKVNVPGLRSKDFGQQPGEGIIEWKASEFRFPTVQDAWRRSTTQHGLGGALAMMGGADPADKDFAGRAAMMDLVASLYLDPIVAAARVSQGVKVARTLPLADEAAQSPLLRRLTQVLPEAATPEIPRSRLARIVYQTFGRNVEELADTGHARRAFQTLARETDPVVIADRYRLPPALADRIAQTRDPYRIRDLFVAGMRGAIPTYERYEIEAKLARNNGEIARLQGQAPQPNLLAGPTPPNPQQGRINALLARNAEMTSDLQRNERLALEVRGVPTDTLAGSYRQAVKRFAAQPTRRGVAGGQSFMDALWRSGKWYEQRAIGKLDTAAQARLEQIQTQGQRMQDELADFHRRAKGDPALFRQDIEDLEKALDKLAATKVAILDRGGLTDLDVLWQAREMFRHQGRNVAAAPAIRALSWAYNHSASMRSAFEMLPQVGDAISITDKAQGMRVLERLGQVLDVDRRSLDDALRGYLRATGPEDARAAVVDLVKRAKALHPEYVSEILRMHRSSAESLFWSRDADAHDMWSAVKRHEGDDMPFSQPHLSSELLSEIPLPDWQAARDLRRLTTRAQWRIKSTAKPIRIDENSRVARVAVKLGISPHKLITASRLAARPFELADQGAATVVGEGWAKLARAQDLLMSRVWTPGVLLRGGWTLRVVGEEQLRMATAGLASFWWEPGRWLQAVAGKGDFARFAEVPEELMVSYARDFWQKQPTAIRIRKGTHGYDRAWRRELAQLHGAEEMRVWLNYVANEGATGKTVDRVMQWLRGNPRGQDVWAQMRPIIEDVLGPSRTGDFYDADLMRRWVETFQARLQDKTRGNQLLVTLARDGALRMPIERFVAERFGGALPQKLEIALAEYQDLLTRKQPIPHDLHVELQHELGVDLKPGKGGRLRVNVTIHDDDVIEGLLRKMPETAKPNFVKGRGFNWDDNKKPAQWVAGLMDFLGAKPTTRLSRSPTYRQMAAKEYQRLRGLGVSAERATDRASTYAVGQVRRLLYELGERSSLHEQMRHVSTFLNAWQEVSQRWFIDLPLRSGMFGHAALLRRFDILMDGLRESELVYQNDRGEWVTRVPAFDSLVARVMGIPMKTEFGLRGLNMVGNLPGLSPQTLAFLTNTPGIREQWGKPGPLQAIFDVLTPYGPEVNLGPTWMGRAWWALSKGHPVAGIGNGAPPWELFSSRYQKMLWDGALIDAMRVMDAKHYKDTGSTRMAEIARMPEGKDKDAAFADFLQDAESMGRHFFTMRAATGLVLPAQPSFYWPNAEEQRKFYEELNAIPEGSPERRAMYERFLEDHPELSSYLVGKSVADPDVPRPTDEQGDFDIKGYFEQIRDGIRTRLTAEQWEKAAAGAVEYSVIQRDYRDAVEAAGSTAADRLRNFGQVAEASDRRAYALAQLEHLNPIWYAEHQQLLRESAEADGEARRTFEQDVAAQFASDVRVVTQLVNDTPLEDQVDLGELRKTRRLLQEHFGSVYADLTDDQTVEGEVARYWRETMNAYFEQIDGLYAQANQLPKGQRSPFYEQIRRLRNTFIVPEGMPTPEEVLYGMATPEQQENLRLKWASQPPGWLSNFQRRTAGLPVEERTEQFWNTINEGEAAVRDYIRKQHWVPASVQARAEREDFDAWKRQLAAANGLQAEVDREGFSPFDRAWTAGVLTDGHWGIVGQGMTDVRAALSAVSYADDGSPASIDSIVGRPIFDDFAAWLDDQRRRSPDLNAALERWGKLLGGEDPLVGIDLYRVFLFGEFQ